MKKEVLFFNNGNTAVLIDGAQTPNLQMSWAILFVEFLESMGVDPEEFSFHFQGISQKAKFFKTPDTTSTRSKWNWTFNLQGG